MMKKTIEQLVVGVLGEMGLEPVDFIVEHPSDLSHGDYSVNIAMVLAKKIGRNPKELAEEIARHVDTRCPQEIEKVEVAGPGFINFYLSKDFYGKSLEEIISSGENFGKNGKLKGEKVMVEYTDPNPFKEFHIGHLMSNAIGETVSRIVEWNGAEVKRACYQGDVGIHVAKAIWGFRQRRIEEGVEGFIDTPGAWERYISLAYAVGNKAYESDSNAKQEIKDINKAIYDGSGEEWVKQSYIEGRKWSIEYFKLIYNKLGTEFDYNFFESDTGPRGKQIVEENTGKVFEESDGAVVFRAEKYDDKLHTRVFINSEGLPTYEAKELGLAPTKYEKYPYTKSIVITGNEVDSYFRVLLEAMKQIFPELREKTEHLSHGMLRLPTGKMSSRTGDVITAEELIAEVMKKTEGREDVAIGAIKYMILRQAIGGDIVFDFEKSVSTEGDSGVYLQYAYARTNSLLEKAKDSMLTPGVNEGGSEVRSVEKLLYRFPEVVERALEDYAPHYITTYLTELASAYNAFYAQEQVLSDDPESPYRLAITKAFNTVMKNGLNVLGIPAPERI